MILFRRSNDFSVLLQSHHSHEYFFYLQKHFIICPLLNGIRVIAKTQRRQWLEDVSKIKDLQQKGLKYLESLKREKKKKNSQIRIADSDSDSDRHGGRLYISTKKMRFLQF